MDRDERSRSPSGDSSPVGCTTQKSDAEGSTGEPCGCCSSEVSCHCPVIQYPLYPALYSSLPAPGNLLLSPSLDSGYRMKEGADTWRALYQAVSYSQTHLAYHPYNNTSVDVSSSRRKNATRESTSTLKAWLHEHLKNPYPTKGEKIMLAIITKMTLTQVSTWFANARRRLKKENKMTWSARHRPDDEDSDLDEPDSWKNGKIPDKYQTNKTGHDELDRPDNDTLRDVLDLAKTSNNDNVNREGHEDKKVNKEEDTVKREGSKETEKPKIWSLVDTATSVSPTPRPSRPVFPSILPAHLSYLLPAYHTFTGPCYT